MKFLDSGHPFFRPLWRRVAVVLVCLGWGLFEFVSGSPFWGMLFTGAGAYAAWELLIAYAPDETEKE